MPQQRPCRLVIVDDHELLATSLGLALRLGGMNAETVWGPTADEVVAAVRMRAPALVLLDLEMGPPLGSGLDLIQPLIAAGGRVVMLTGVDDPARLGACLELGASGIIGKQAGFDSLVADIQRAVDGEEVITIDYRDQLLSGLRARRQAVLDGAVRS